MGECNEWHSLKAFWEYEKDISPTVFTHLSLHFIVIVSFNPNCHYNQTKKYSSLSVGCSILYAEKFRGEDELICCDEQQVLCVGVPTSKMHDETLYHVLNIFLIRMDLFYM